MSNLVMWNLLVGFLAPHLIALVQQPSWKPAIRAGVTGVVSVVFGAGTAYFNGDIHDWHDVVGSILIVAVAAVSFYNHLWKPTGIPQRIEAATSSSNANQRGYVGLDYAFTVLASVALVTLVMVSVTVMGFFDALGALVSLLE